MRAAVVLILAATFASGAWAESNAALPASAAEDLAAARALFTARRDAEAQAAFERIATTAPSNHEALYHLGRLAKRRGDWAAAAARYARCTELAPSNALYWADLGEAYGALAAKAGVFQQLGLARKCRAALEKAVELEPGNLDYQNGLIEFYEEAPAVAGGGRDKALAQAATLGVRSPYGGALATGTIHMHARDFAAAETAFRQAAQLQPEATEPLDALGLLYADQQRYPDAFAQFDQLLARQPGDPAALYQLGRVAAISGLRLADGEAALRHYLEFSSHPDGQPTNAHAQYRLGDILARRGDIAAARSAYQAALQLDPGLKPAAEALARLPR